MNTVEKESFELKKNNKRRNKKKTENNKYKMHALKYKIPQNIKLRCM